VAGIGINGRQMRLRSAAAHQERGWPGDLCRDGNPDKLYKKAQRAMLVGVDEMMGGQHRMTCEERDRSTSSQGGGEGGCGKA
jgi:hypothetical protein